MYSVLDVMNLFKLELVINRYVVLSHMCAYKCLRMYVVYSPAIVHFSKLHLHCIWQGGNNHDGEFSSLLSSLFLQPWDSPQFQFSPQALNDSRNNYLLA